MLHVDFNLRLLAARKQLWDLSFLEVFPKGLELFDLTNILICFNFLNFFLCLNSLCKSSVLASRLFVFITFLIVKVNNLNLFDSLDLIQSMINKNLDGRLVLEQACVINWEVPLLIGYVGFSMELKQDLNDVISAMGSGPVQRCEGCLRV